MISLETARKLKEAGLKWEPQEGDLCYDTQNERITSITEEDGEFYQKIKDTQANELVYFRKNTIWIPRLDQLLAEIEWYFNWNIGSGEFWPDKPKYCMGLFGEDGQYVKGQFYANSPDEAAAQALIWILEQEGQADEF